MNEEMKQQIKKNIENLIYSKIPENDKAENWFDVEITIDEHLDNMFADLNEIFKEGKCN